MRHQQIQTLAVRGFGSNQLKHCLGRNPEKAISRSVLLLMLTYKHFIGSPHLPSVTGPDLRLPQVPLCPSSPCSTSLSPLGSSLRQPSHTLLVTAPACSSACWGSLCCAARLHCTISARFRKTMVWGLAHSNPSTPHTLLGAELIQKYSCGAPRPCVLPKPKEIQLLLHKGGCMIKPGCTVSDTEAPNDYCKL